MDSIGIALTFLSTSPMISDFIRRHALIVT